MRKLLLPLLFLLPLVAVCQDDDDTTGSDLTNEEAAAVLAHHNKARAELNLPPLVWSAAVAAHAQQWADSLAGAEACDFRHRQRNRYGENLFATSAPRASFNPVTASEAWYAEKARYTYSRIGEAGSKGAGHYTAMVWRKTTELGVGMATCKNGNTIVVANYNPVGNYSGEYPY